MANINQISPDGGTTVYDIEDPTARSSINSLTPRVGIAEGKITTLEGQMLSVEDDLGGLGTASTKNSTSVVTQSTDLVESGAVKDAIVDTVGWISDEQAKLYNWIGSGAGITFTYTKEQLTLNGTATGNTSQPSSGVVPEDGKYTLKAGTYKIECDVNDVYWEVLSLNPVAFITQDSKPFTITEDTAVFIRANIKSGASFDNKVVHVSLRKLSVDEIKADNSVIGTVEDGTTASQAYAVNDVFIRNGALCKVTSAISQGDTLSNQFTVTNVGAILTALLNA